MKKSMEENRKSRKTLICLRNLVYNKAISYISGEDGHCNWIIILKHTKIGFIPCVNQRNTKCIRYLLKIELCTTGRKQTNSFKTWEWGKFFNLLKAQMEYGIQCDIVDLKYQLQVQSLEVTTPSKNKSAEQTEKSTLLKSLTDSYKDTGQSDAP